MDNHFTKCPVCNSEGFDNLIELNCGNYDKSTLYQIVRIVSCKKCGHVYNNLNKDDITGLEKYYNSEYTPTNIASADKEGDRPGSSNRNTMQRYQQIYSLIGSKISHETKVLDVGCAMGGFLDYLYDRGCRQLSGIDISEKYVEKARQQAMYCVKTGSAEAIPFTDDTFDVLFMDQVLEHLYEPRKAFREAKRVLTDDGLFCIGVPDASRYDENFFFDFYWFLMREHLQHFDIGHLEVLANSEGFELETYTSSDTPMMSERMLLPNLSAVFRLKNKPRKKIIAVNSYILKKKIEEYIKQDFEKTNKKIKIIDNIIKSGNPMYAWGIGREFLYLYENSGLKNYDFSGLIDGNLFKQGKFSLKGIEISDSHILKNAVVKTNLLITAFAHIDAICRELERINFKGNVVVL